MIGGIWQFLKDQGAILGSIAAIVAIAGGIWKFVAFFAKKSEKGPLASSASADHGSVGIVGNITKSTITIGNIQPEQLEALVQARIRPYQETSETQKKLIARLETDLDLNERQLRAAFNVVGDANVPPEQLAAKLVGIAEHIKVLRAENEQLRRGPPALAAIAEEVQGLIDKGEFDDARRALARGREAARALRIDASRYEAAFLAQEARVDALQLVYRTAAAKYAEAATLVAPFDTEQQWRFLLAQAGELYKQGYEFGDNPALTEAIDVYRWSLALAPHSEQPLDWAMTQMNLGLALFRLGERESGIALLQEAVSAYHEALQEYTRERVPLDWAKTQNNLGMALGVLGEREGGTARLTEAVSAYREALLEYTPARAPLEFAKTQNNLGLALLSLGERESGTAWLEEAVAAFRDALQELTRACVPLDWAAAQSNLGNALRALGERESGTERLEAAVTACREALQENTRARVPLQWAMTQHNLAEAYRALFERDHQPRHLDDALEAVDGALEEYRKAKAVFYIEWAKGERGKILAAKGKL